MSHVNSLQNFIFTSTFRILIYTNYMLVLSLPPTFTVVTISRGRVDKSLSIFGWITRSIFILSLNIYPDNSFADTFGKYSTLAIPNAS
jgi:hypothetical protein